MQNCFTELVGRKASTESLEDELDSDGNQHSPFHKKNVNKNDKRGGKDGRLSKFQEQDKNTRVRKGDDPHS